LQQGINLPGSAVVLENYEASIEGGYKKVLGYSKWSEEKVPGDTIINGIISVTADDAIAVVGGKYYLSSGKAAWVEKLDSSLNPGGHVRHVAYNFTGTDKIIMTNGATKPVIYTSGTDTIAIDSAASTDVEGSEYVTEFKNHIFFGNGTNLVFTAPYTDDDYTPGNGAGIINIGSEITGLIPFRGELIIFGTDRINRLTGSSLADFVLTPITRKTGCLYGDTIQEVGGDILYLGPDGIRYLSATDRNEDFALQRASEAIQDYVVDFYSGTSTFTSTVVRKKSQYRVFDWQETTSVNLSGGIIGTRFLDQQAAGISWSTMRGVKPHRMDSKQHGNTESVLFTSDATVGGSYVYEMESGNSFDGGAIACRWKTPNMPFSDPKIRKTFYKATLYLATEADFSISCQPVIDGNTGNTIEPPAVVFAPSGATSVSFWGTPLWGDFTYGGALDQVYYNNLIGSGFTVAFDFIEESASSSFALDSLIIEYRQNDRK